MVEFFRIGMTQKEVMSRLSSIHSSDPNKDVKTRKWFNNFWSKDYDKKVTNEIELEMLNTWALGSKNVKMPVSKSDIIDRTRGNLGYTSIHRNVYLSESDDCQGVDSFSRIHYCDKEIKSPLENSCHDVARWSRIQKQNEIIIDELVDNDMDGIADVRYFTVQKLDQNNTVIETFEFEEDLHEE